jgi:superfamily II DNA or RNA helicase
MILRDYQKEMKDRLETAWKKYRSVMVQMPTGTGKTYLMAEVIRGEKIEVSGERSEVRGENGGVLIVAHRVELIGQISQTLDAFGVPHGVIDRWTKDIDEVTSEHQVVVASIQTLSRRIQNTDGTDLTNFRPKVVIVDEAHHAVAKTYRLLWDVWPEAKFLGLTATPCRLNYTGFTDLFDTLLESYSIQHFIDKGWLSDFEYVSVTPDNILVGRIAGLKKRGVDGDYQTKEMATVMDSPESIAHLYRSYEQFAKGKKGIIYAISREHAQHIADYYMKQGVKCCWIEAMTPAEERHQLVDAYREGRMDVIVNVDIFSEGFDCPEVEFIQLARPTLSLSKYLQQVGRGMRYIPNKDYVVILDQVGMYQTFGLPTEDRDWNLMFQGKMTGRGHQGSGRGYIIRGEGNERTLVNLEMVRIKRHGEKSTGVEIFIKDGRYGVLKDGKVTCEPEFEHIQRIPEGPYFAIATYPYEVYKGRSTVISQSGMDLRVRLFGKVVAEGDVVEGENMEGRPAYWDGVGQAYYDAKPEFETVGGVEMVRQNGKYLLRQHTTYLKEPVGKEDIWYNKYILWMKDVVIVKGTGAVFPVKAFGDECFYVPSDNKLRGRYQRVELNGMLTIPYLSGAYGAYVYMHPNWKEAQMIRASSGKREYMDKDYVKEKNKVQVY